MYFFSKKPKQERTVETLAQFKQRTAFVDAPFSSDSILLNPNCWKKVNERGEFKPFYGDTVVYLFDDNVKAKCRYLQSQLYKYCPDVFAEPLHEDTFHLTLHDLNNHSDYYQIIRQIESTKDKVVKLMNSFIQDPTVIHLKSTRIINMVNTSLVLCFEPETESDCQKLMTYYDMFQEVLPLSYSLTPHVTLAYFNAAFDSLDENMNFRSSFISSQYTKQLKEIVDDLNQCPSIHLELSVFDLAYQHFTSMNQYRTEYQLKESILIAEDAAFMRVLMKDILKDIPVTIHEADSAGQLIQKIEEEYPSVILLDGSLPGCGPYEALEIIQELHPGAAVIYLANMPVCQEKLQQLGASSYLTKPLQRESFKKEVLKYLHNKEE